MGRGAEGGQWNHTPGAGAQSRVNGGRFRDQAARSGVAWLAFGRQCVLAESEEDRHQGGEPLRGLSVGRAGSLFLQEPWCEGDLGKAWTGQPVGLQGSEG